MRISDWSSDVCSSDLCGQRYAAEQLAAAGARTRRSGENGAHWLADLERSGFLRRQKHPGNHVYLFPLTKAARIAARAVPSLPYPVLDRVTSAGDVTALPLLARKRTRLNSSH